MNCGRPPPDHIDAASEGAAGPPLSFPILLLLLLLLLWARGAACLACCFARVPVVCRASDAGAIR